MSYNVKIVCNSKTEQRKFDKKILLFDILTENRIFFHAPCGGRGVCKKCEVIVNGEKCLACQTYVESDCTLEVRDGQFEISDFFTLPEFPKNPISEEGAVVAVVDIGTTTVKAYLMSMPEMEVLQTVTQPNKQGFAGSDVISRIERGAELSSVLKNQIDSIINDFSKTPEFTVITGNTAMLYFYNGLDVKPLGMYPFETAELFGKWEKNIYFPRCVSAYVGADAMCSLLASGVTKQKEKCALVVDIGTNSEILLWDKGKITVSSASAGPVFEGALIQKGMFAQNGAINKVFLENGNVCYETIGGGSPSGICGSGLIDAISVMLCLGVIDQSGYMEKDFYIADSGVCITPEDIRNVQLAKSAICSAVEIITANSVPDELYIAGGFGNSIDVENAVKIGLFPENITRNVKFLGNGAAGGAAMLLWNKDYMELVCKLAESAIVKELSLDDEFTSRYIKNLNFSA